MPTNTSLPTPDSHYDEPVDRVDFEFGSASQVTRRQFMQLLGAGLLIAVNDHPASAQRTAGRGGGRGGDIPTSLGTRLHIGQDGIITVFSGKVEGGQGVRAQLTQAAAE